MTYATEGALISSMLGLLAKLEPWQGSLIIDLAPATPPHVVIEVGHAVGPRPAPAVPVEAIRAAARAWAQQWQVAARCSIVVSSERGGFRHVRVRS